VSQAVYVVIGAVVGALATGGVAAVDAERKRRQARRVAARLILGGLYLTEVWVEAAKQWNRWPDAVDIQTQLDTWDQCREAFAGDVEAWEWAVVDNVYSNLHRYAVTAKLTGKRELPLNLQLFVDELHKARDIALRKAASRRQRRRFNEELYRLSFFAAAEIS
jgi:hypothetical protein